MASTKYSILLTGNPNSGKTSLFNFLTGLNHKVGNFPGVTVEKKTGHFHEGSYSFEVIDIPGTYSLYPKSLDEAIAYKALSQQKKTGTPDRLNIIITDGAHLKRSLLYATQVIDLGFPVIMAVSMLDTAHEMGKKVDIHKLSTELGITVVGINSRTGEGINELKLLMQKENYSIYLPKKNIFADILAADKEMDHSHDISAYNNHYHAFHSALAHEYKDGISFQSIQKEKLTRIQSNEINIRFQKIQNILEKTGVEQPGQTNEKVHQRTYNWDKILLHPVLGYLFMFAILYIVFQGVFWLANYPMDFIDEQFSTLGSWVSDMLPESWWSDLLVNGIIAGLGGIVIFIPQIAILFFFLTILEDTGYLSRISFLMDRLFQSIGLSGKSVVPLLSGMACAIPAVMAARTIENPKHRLITILITPFMSCTARLPVYAILISLVIPETYIWGFIGLQGLVFMGMYLLGFITALIAGKVLTYFINKDQKSYFIQELPVYQSPRWGNAFNTMYEKSKIFLFQAGKIIITISIALWFLLTYGPSSQREPIEETFAQLEQSQGGLTEEQESEFQSMLIESSYGGLLGKLIEPAIQPLGYDWKIGIALISSFAAREVFVATMATIYSVGELDDDDTPLRIRLQQETKPDGTPVYGLATGISLMLFYAFAMQCMATLAIVKRELNSWKWALIQMLGMTGLAYIVSLIAYQLLK